MTASVIAGLLFHTICEFVKAFGRVSAIRNSSTNHFFCRPLCLGDKKTSRTFLHLAKMLWNTGNTVREPYCRCIQLCSKRKELGEEEEGRTHLDEKINISSSFF